jgi:hypothetical protein
MQRTNEFVQHMFEGDEAAAAAALAELTDPHRVADEVRRQMETRRVLDEFVAANQDLVGDQRLTFAADQAFARETGGRRIDDLDPSEAQRALTNAGRYARAWLKRFAPRDEQEPAETGTSSIIERMRRARGQA